MSKGSYGVNGAGRGGQYGGNGWGKSGWYGHREGNHAAREGGPGKRLETGNLDGKRAYGASQNPGQGVLVGTDAKPRPSSSPAPELDYQTRKTLEGALGKALLAERRANGQLGPEQIARVLHEHSVPLGSEVANRVLSHAQSECWLLPNAWSNLDAFERVGK